VVSRQEFTVIGFCVPNTGTQIFLNVPGAFGPTLLNNQLKITTQIATAGIAYKF